MQRGFALLLGAALLFCAVPAHAQFTGVDPLTVTLSPQDPGPYQTVTVTPQSTTIDLVSGTVRVSVNGTVVSDGAGASSVPVTVGGPGESTTISVRATVDGQTYDKSITIRPASVALIVDPISTTHPFYEGASLPAPSGRVRVVALADLRSNASTRLAPQNLVYTWKVGDQTLTDQSGMGRSVLSATAPIQYRDAEITVTVTSPSNPNLVAQASTLITPVAPIARMYLDDALMGPLFDHALGSTFAMAGEEESIRGVGYFFGATPSLAWAVNGQAASSEQDVTVRTTGAGAGTAGLSLVASSQNPSQSASAQTSVQFGAKSASNIFGF